MANPELSAMDYVRRSNDDQFVYYNIGKSTVEEGHPMGREEISLKDAIKQAGFLVVSAPILPLFYAMESWADKE